MGKQWPRHEPIVTVRMPSKQRGRIGHVGRTISDLRTRRPPKPSGVWHSTSQPPACRPIPEGGDVRRSSKAIWENSQRALGMRLTRTACDVKVRAWRFVTSILTKSLRSAPVGFDDGRHSDIPGSLSVQLRMPRKIVERPKQVLVPLVQEPPRTRIARS